MERECTHGRSAEASFAAEFQIILFHASPPCIAGASRICSGLVGAPQGSARGDWGRVDRMRREGAGARCRGGNSSLAAGEPGRRLVDGCLPAASGRRAGKPGRIVDGSSSPERKSREAEGRTQTAARRRRADARGRRAAGPGSRRAGSRGGGAILSVREAVRVGRRRLACAGRA